MKRFIWFFAVLTVILLPIPKAKALDCLRFAVSDGSEVLKTSSQKFSNLLTANSICHSLLRLPSKRVHANFLKGELDGDFGRVHFYGEIIKDRGIKVPTPLFVIGGFLVTKDKSIKSANDLTKNLGILRGRIWMQKIAGPLDKIEIIRVNDLAALSKMLTSDRIEAVLVTQQQLDSFRPIGDYNILRVMDLNVHVWLAKKNEKLAPIFDSLIKNYHKDGNFFLN